MMRRLARLHKDSQGFTLVELMIVVAIIGILAAIAIPQFAAYRIRGFNSSALNDMRNLNTMEAAFFADWQVYGHTAIAVGAGVGAGAVLTGPGGAATLITAVSAAVNRSMQLGIGNGVSIAANAAAAAAGPPVVAANSSYTVGSKHLNGDTIYGSDSDFSINYKAQLAAFGPGVVLTNVIANIPLALTGTNEYAALAGFGAM